MWLKTYNRLIFEIPAPTPFITMLRPRSGSHQWVAKEAFNLAPSTPVLEFEDHFGNLCQRLIAPAGSFSIETYAQVETAGYVAEAPGADFTEIQNLPVSTLPYLLPSRYCESDRLLTAANQITANQKPGYDQVAEIESWLRKNIQYTPGESFYTVSALETYNRQTGVCRDLAHLGIALCRSLSIPARLVAGYLYKLNPMDLHAWFEAFVGGQWYTFDAVHTGPKGGYVALGYGRDATDVAIYNQFGPPVFLNTFQVDVEEIFL